MPLLVRWDGHIEPDREIDHIAAQFDIFPTPAHLAGARKPEGQVEGRDLLPLREDSTTDWPDRLWFTHNGRWKTGPGGAMPCERSGRPSK